MMQIQQAPIDTDRDDKNFHSEDWEILVEGETPESALRGLVALINGEELDDVNHWFRIVDTETEQVL